jgi:hypothetical protein
VKGRSVGGKAIMKGCGGMFKMTEGVEKEEGRGVMEELSKRRGVRSRLMRGGGWGGFFGNVDRELVQDVCVVVVEVDYLHVDTLRSVGLMRQSRWFEVGLLRLALLRGAERRGEEWYCKLSFGVEVALLVGMSEGSLTGA